MQGASIYFRSARLEAAVGTRQRSCPTAILLSAAKRLPDYARAGTVTLEKEKEKKKRGHVSRLQEESRVLRIAVIRKLTTLVSFAMTKVTWAPRDGKLPEVSRSS